jgi:hypothetical protein
VAITMKQLLFRRGALAALTTTLAVIVALLLLPPLRVLVAGLASLRVSPQTAFAPVPGDLLLHVLPFGVGVFLSLWILAPVAAELSLGFVVTRSVLAAVVGAIVLFLTTICLGIPGLVAPGSVFWLRADGISLDFVPVGRTILQSLTFSLLFFVDGVAIVVLGAIFQWNWLKRHPPAFGVAGLIDEV